MVVESRRKTGTQAISQGMHWWRPIRQHLWAIIAFAAVVLLCVGALPFVLDPLFDSHALVEVRSAAQPPSNNPASAEEQRRLLMRTQLKLAADLASVEDLRPYSYVELVPDTQLLAIHFQAPRADLARNGANTVAQAFVRHTTLLRDHEIEEAAQVLALEIASINGASVFQVPEILDMRSAPLIDVEPDALGQGAVNDAGLSAFRSGALEGSLGSQLEAGLVAQFLSSYEGALARVVHARILNSAFLPDEAVVRISPIVVILIGVLAVALPAGYVVLRDQLRTTLDYPSDISRWLGQTCLGSLPKARHGSDHTLCNDSEYRAAFEHVQAELNLQRPVSDELTQFASGRIIMVSSAHRGEGKTGVALNLAIALSKNEPVLLINGDMNVSRNIMGIAAGAAGLSHLIAGAAQMRDCIHRVSGHSLDVMPAGVLPPNTTDLLCAPRFSQILASLRRRYKTIILDAPSFEASADALFLAAHSDDIIYVVSTGISRADEAKTHLHNVVMRGANVAGVVMNESNRQRQKTRSDLRVTT